MRRIVELFKLVAILSILLTTGLSRCGAQDLAVIQKGKAAVALIEAGPNKVASAFCIDPLGIFVTNHHVVEDLASELASS